jgi:MinD-like ATPase involved in chromosome partitioning or flagellar assembly
MSDPQKEALNGRIVTFYSYKGGTGRTMLLANVAWILAANGRRVLVADWDLESPGLHRFLYPFLKGAMRDARGITDLIRDYERVAARSDDEERDKHIAEHSRIQRYAFSLNWKFRDEGTLDFLSPGKQDKNYMATAGALDWDTFYETLKGGKFLDTLREDMRRHYDYVLIDSRTGLGDIADICTVHLPDVLVDCFALSTQNVEGAAQIARFIGDQHRRRGIRVLPVPMRIELGEKERADAGRAFATRLFPGLPAGMSDGERKAYWAAVAVPYHPFYAFEEMLAVFGDEPGNPASMLSSFERITAYITNGVVTQLPPMDEDLRIRTRQLFVRMPPAEMNRITVEFLAEDQAWAEWISAVLIDGGFTVSEQRLERPVAADAPELAPPRTLTVVSAAYAAQHRIQAHGQPNPAQRPGLAVYLTMAQSLLEFPMAASAFLAGLPEADAVNRIRKLVGLGPVLEDERPQGVRYPGIKPKVYRVNAKNERFTGREDDLRNLREQLRTYGTTWARPVVLHGLGGVGKTQVALEYVNRFSTDYDLVWWLDCGQPQFIDISLADLGVEMEKHFGVSPPPGSTTRDVRERAELVLSVLSQGSATQRWLLVYDNAENIEAILPLIPHGGGHVLITSQEGGWHDHAHELLVDLFKREESVAHLLRWVPSLTAEEASQVAAAVADLPLAIAAAAAWLDSTKYPVSRYLRELEREAEVPNQLSIGELADYEGGVLRAWGPSLNLLQERSPAAMRLLQLCSVMAPAIATDLIYSPAMARLLEPFDAELSSVPRIIGRLVQQIRKLALLKLGRGEVGDQVEVHRLVQAFVRGRMSAEERDSARQDVHKVLVDARSAQEVDKEAAWPRLRQLWPHLEPADVVSSDDEKVRQLIIDRVRYIHVFSQFERAGDEAIAAERRWQAMLDAKPHHPAAAERSLRRQLLLLRFHLGNTLRFQSRFREARELDESVLAAQEELLGRDHPHTLATAGSVAADRRALGRYHDALAMDEKTYASWTELYGHDDPGSLRSANNLAVSLRVTGHMADALRLDTDTLDRFRATAGPQDRSMLLANRNVVRDLLEAGKYGDAVTQIRDVWRSCVDAFGASSQDALDAQVLMGVALRSAGRPEDAELEYLAALSMLTSRFGESHADTLACRISHASNLLSLDRIAEADASIREVLAEYEKRLGDDHPHSLVCKVNLASALRLQSMQVQSPQAKAIEAQAMTTINGAIDGLEPTLGPKHPYTLAARMVYGTLLADQGDLSKAAAVETETIAALEETLGPSHPDTIRCEANLLLTQRQNGRDTIAELNSVIKQLQDLIGSDHPSIETLRAGRRLLRALDPQPF